MEANQIDSEKFGSEFPDSSKIEAGDVIEATLIKEFNSKDGLRGASLTDKDGKLYHTTAKQPVGYILSPNVGLNALIEKAEDNAVTLYFSNEVPENSTRSVMLKCSVFKPRG